MKKLIILNLKKHSLLILFLLFILLSFTSCAKYTAYTGKIENLDFYFEYPITWYVDSSSGGTTFSHISIKELNLRNSDYDYPVYVQFSVMFKLDSPPEQFSQDQINGVIDRFSNRPNFELINNNSFMMDGCESLLLEYIYDARHLTKEGYCPTRTLDIFIPKNDRVYNLHITAGQSDWERNQDNIYRILDTFKWN